MKEAPIIIVTIILLLMNMLNCTKILTEEYCWRDFDGIIPRDAFIAGYDNRNNPLYVGQVFFEDKRITGELHQNDDTIYYEYGEQERTANRNIKILCAEFQEKFSWVPTSNSQYRYVKSRNLVKGGHQPGFDTYIGRVRDSNGQTHVGKLICREDNCLSLYTSKKGERWKEFNRYDILVYDQDSKGKEESGDLILGLNDTR